MQRGGPFARWPIGMGSNQGIANLDLPTQSGMPNMPRRIRSGRFRPVTETSDVFDEAAFALLNGEMVVPVGITSILVLPQPAALRNFLGFRNSSATALEIYVAFGTPATLNSWLRLTQNTIVLLDTVVPQDNVYCICSGAAGQVTVVVSTTPGQTA
jgi:hypothetical protein